MYSSVDELDKLEAQQDRFRNKISKSRFKRKETKPLTGKFYKAEYTMIQPLMIFISDYHVKLCLLKFLNLNIGVKPMVGSYYDYYVTEKLYPEYGYLIDSNRVTTPPESHFDKYLKTEKSPKVLLLYGKIH